MRAVAVILAGLLVGGCAAGTPTSVSTTGPSAVAPGASPPGGSDGEQQLLAGVRTDLTGRCSPMTDAGPELAIATIECTPEKGAVSLVRVSLFDSQETMLGAYADVVGGWDMQIPHDGAGCAGWGGSEGSYIPGDGRGGVLLPERHACLVFEDGFVRTVTTVPPYVLVMAQGSTDDPAGVERWAFLGNKDQPGGPTVWSRFGPQSPEK